MGAGVLVPLGQPRSSLCWCVSVGFVCGWVTCIRNRYKERKSAQWHIFCQCIGPMIGRLLVGAPDCWPTISRIFSDGKEVEDIFRCLAEITLNTMLYILLMLEYLGVLHLSNLIQLYILSTPNGGVTLTYILHLTEYEEILFRAQEPKAPVTYCDHALSVVRPSVCPLDNLHFQLILQNRLMDFDETWYGGCTQGPLQVLLFSAR